MCGILGGISPRPFDKGEVESALGAIAHRGPDNSGIQSWEVSDKHVFFGHRRLSIIDLSDAGNQPMVTPDGKYAVCFNGEIYNYAEIKKELAESGITFETNSDTEVILHAYVHWGVDFVNKCIGMFAIALLDISRDKLYLFRDRAGVKPLYYSLYNDELLFASELKSLMGLKRFDHKKRFNSSASTEFLKKGWIPAPNTIFTDTFKLLPGSCLEFDIPSGVSVIHKYWDSDSQFAKPKNDLEYEDVLEKTEALLKSACEYRMVADTKVGVFLSGGYDSSLVTALLQSNRKEKLSTFSIGFDVEEFNEAPYARQVAEHLGTDHHELIIGEQDALSALDDLPFYFDEPFGDSSAIPTMLVSRLASEHVKVALSADGGDEVFGGYTRYYVPFGEIDKAVQLRKLGGKFLVPILKSLKRPTHPQERVRYEKLMQVMKMKDPRAASSVRIEPNHFSDEELDQLYYNPSEKVQSGYMFTDKINHLDRIDFIRALEYRTTMVDDILVKVDRSSMASSLESREPLLDHRLVEWVGQLRENSLHGGVYPKRVLRDICHKYIPESIMNRPKKGFAIPTEKWMKGVLKERLKYYCSPSFIESQGLFNSNAVQVFLEEYLNGTDRNHERPWIFMMHQMWWEKWMS